MPLTSSNGYRSYYFRRFFIRVVYSYSPDMPLPPLNQQSTAHIPPPLSLWISHLSLSPHSGSPTYPYLLTSTGDDLYAALIETFMYSMVKFNVSDCTLIICVTDPKCMKLCADQHFPCYDYRSKQQANQWNITLIPCLFHPYSS